jgi:lipopolysaccharide export system protein LptA
MRLARLLIPLLSLAAPAIAVAEGDSGSKKPIDITANEAEVVQSKCLAIWRGQAEARQGEARLRADTISVYAVVKSVGADGKPVCGGTDRIEATGRVFYVTDKQSARGDKAIYSQSADTVVMTGNVVVIQGDDVAQGERLTIKVGDKSAVLEPAVDASGKPRRVRGVFYPAKTEDTPAGGEAKKP